MYEIFEIIVRVDKPISRFEFERINAHIARIIGIKCTTWVMDAILFSIDAGFMSVIIIPPHGISTVTPSGGLTMAGTRSRTR